jgi:hypothetical protein
MKVAYPVIFRYNKRKDLYSVTIPDLDVDEKVPADDYMDIIESIIVDACLMSQLTGEKLPTPSDINNISIAKKETIEMVEVDLDDFEFYEFTHEGIN